MAAEVKTLKLRGPKGNYWGGVELPYRRMPPTRKHRKVFTPGILGTVYAYNADGVERYFDYDWNAAVAYAGVTADSDLRVQGRGSRLVWYGLA